MFEYDKKIIYSTHNRYLHVDMQTNSCLLRRQLESGEL